MTIEMKDISSVLIIGIAGGLAKITAGLLSKKYPELSITGVDSRPVKLEIQTENIKTVQMKYTRGNFERIFREKQFDAVLHLGRMSHADANPMGNLEKRLDLNVMGTKRIMDLALRFGVKKNIIVSTYHVYGALADNPVFIDEEAHLKASIKYPELRDVVEMDLFSTNWMWKNQAKIETVVLRPCSIIGPNIRNSMCLYLTSPYAPIGADFNPMFQFIHEYDMANVVIRALEKVPTGIYNIAPSEVISIKEARKVIGQPSIPVPLIFLEQTVKLLNFPFWKFPRYLLDYIKFACIIDNKAIAPYLGEDFYRFTTKEALELLKLE